MNSQQIDRILKRHVGRRFQGVFSSDNLPERPTLLIANTEPANRPGDHWVAISVDRSGNGQYFDSYGRPPSKTFRDYMNRHCRKKTWTYSRKQLQSAASNVCGQYCIVWCLLNSRAAVDLSRLLYTSDTGLNDSIVKEIVSRM